MIHLKQLTAVTRNETQENAMIRRKRPLKYVLFGLFSLAWLALTPPALAQPCAGTTLSGPVASNSTVTCDSGTTVIDHDDLSTGSPALEASGTDPVSLINRDTITGAMDFSGLNQGYTVDNNAGAEWRLRGSVSDLGAGTFNNSGTIDFTNISGIQIISAPGTSFTGAGDSLLVMDVFLDGTAQTACSDATVADCLDLTGGSTAGDETMILLNLESTEELNGPLRSATSANAGIVLVDVSGGTSSADHFVLDPDSDNYAEDPVYGSVLNLGGPLSYALLYDPNTQQHLLASVPKEEGVQYVSFIQEAMSIWHTTSDAVAGRQAELRDGATGKMWFRFVGEQTKRDAAPTFTSHGNSFVYEQDYSMYTGALIAGSDMVSSDDHVIGLHVGLVTSSLDFEGSGTDDRIDGATFGAYGGWWNDAGLSLDGTVNANFLKLEHNVSDEFESSDTNIMSLGVRGEAGWRLPLLGETLYVQPLATAAYVKADVNSVLLQDNTLRFENEESLRGALGVRLGGSKERFSYWLTARAWDEQVDDGSVHFSTSDGDPLVIEDDRSGSFEEVDFGVSGSNGDNTLSGYISGGVTFDDEVDNYNISVGARLNW